MACTLSITPSMFASYNIGLTFLTITYGPSYLSSNFMEILYACSSSVDLNSDTGLFTNINFCPTSYSTNSRGCFTLTLNLNLFFSVCSTESSWYLLIFSYSFVHSYTYSLHDLYYWFLEQVVATVILTLITTVLIPYCNLYWVVIY